MNNAFNSILSANEVSAIIAEYGEKFGEEIFKSRLKEKTKENFNFQDRLRIENLYDELSIAERKEFSDAVLEILWNAFENVCIDENENIDVNFHIWKTGTFREDIWHWIDSKHTKGVGWIMNERDEY